MNGQKIEFDKIRVREKEGSVEIPLEIIKALQEEDPLVEAVFKRMIHEISTRNYKSTLDEPLGDDRKSVSKSNVSRKFVIEATKILDELTNRKIEDDYPVIMMDGINVGKYLIVVALGIQKNGNKRILGLLEGSTENSIICMDLFDNLIERGLSPDINRLFVIDGSKALRKAIIQKFDKKAVIQRCRIHKKRNVLSYLPKSEEYRISQMMNKAYLEPDFDKAKRLLLRIVNQLDIMYPDAANSLREGLDETLTVNKLKAPGLLKKTLANTNTIESAFSVASNACRNVKHYSSGKMALRWLASGLYQSEKRFHRIKGYKELPILINSINNYCEGVDWKDDISYTQRVS